MARKENPFSQMYLADALRDEVDAWVKEGWPGVTQTTYELLHYWFGVHPRQLQTSQILCIFLLSIKKW